MSIDKELYKHIGKQIKIARENKNISYDTLAELIDYKKTKSSLKRYEDGESRIELDILELICNQIGLNYYDVVHNAKEMISKNEVIEETIDYSLKTEVNNFFTLPYFKNLSAGCFDEIIEDEFDDVVNLVNVPNKFFKRKKRLIAFEVNGDSMNKIIPSKSIVVIEKKEEFKPGDIVVAQTETGCTLKRYRLSNENLILMPESTNETFLPMAFSKNESVRILGKVVWYCPPEDIFE